MFIQNVVLSSLRKLCLLQVHAFSPNTNLVWRVCASLPGKTTSSKTAVIDGMVYVGGGVIEDDDDDTFHVYKYDSVKNEWSILPPTPVRYFGVGTLNGKLVIVGGVSKEVRIFDEDTQQWVESISPMPTRLAFSLVVTHNTSLIVCGMTDESSPPSMFIYRHQSSQWHSRAPPPLNFYTDFSSAVIVNDTYYLSLGTEGVANADPLPSSAAVFSQPLSTLLDPNTPSTWQRMPDTPCHTSCLATTGGCLLALGGLHNVCNIRDASAANITSAVYAYCPAISSWVKIGGLPDTRACSTITTLSSGEIFITGGWIYDEFEDNDLSVTDKTFIGTIN